MDKRLTFNEDVINYDRWRPHYNAELFADIAAYAGLEWGMKAVEIGCGTGQATKPILDRGCQVTAVEFGEQLAAFTREKFKQYRHLQVLHCEFEQFAEEEATVDLVYSATAFHWIKAEIGYPKVFRMLKPGAALALFWNRPFVNRSDDPLHQEIQDIYKRYSAAGSWNYTAPMIEHDSKLYQARKEIILAYGFNQLEHKLYKQVRTFDAPGYIALLHTYSDHRALPPEIRQAFMQEIQQAIVDYGNVLHIYDTIDLYLARKP